MSYYNDYNWEKNHKSKKDSSLIYKYSKYAKNALDENEIYNIIINNNYIEEKIINEIKQKAKIIEEKGDDYGWKEVKKGKLEEVRFNNRNKSKGYKGKKNYNNRNNYNNSNLKEVNDKKNNKNEHKNYRNYNSNDFYHYVSKQPKRPFQECIEVPSDYNPNLIKGNSIITPGENNEEKKIDTPDKNNIKDIQKVTPIPESKNINEENKEIKNNNEEKKKIENLNEEKKENSNNNEEKKEDEIITNDNLNEEKKQIEINNNEEKKQIEINNNEEKKDNNKNYNNEEKKDNNKNYNNENNINKNIIIQNNKKNIKNENEYEIIKEEKKEESEIEKENELESRNNTQFDQLSLSEDSSKLENKNIEKEEIDEEREWRETNLRVYLDKLKNYSMTIEKSKKNNVSNKDYTQGNLYENKRYEKNNLTIQSNNLNIESSNNVFIPAKYNTPFRDNLLKIINERKKKNSKNNKKEYEILYPMMPYFSQYYNQFNPFNLELIEKNN